MKGPLHRAMNGPGAAAERASWLLPRAGGALANWLLHMPGGVPLAGCCPHSDSCAPYALGPPLPPLPPSCSQLQ